MLKKSILTIACLGLFSAGCASTPGWVKGIVDMDDAGVTALYGVGMARKGPNLAATRTKAEARGRAELAKQIETYASSFIKDFIEEHRDYMADPESQSSTEFFSSVAKNIAEATLSGSMLIDTYQDDEHWYSLIKMTLDNKFVDQFKKRVAASVRTKQGVVLEEKTNQMLEDLDKELAKKTARQGM